MASALEPSVFALCAGTIAATVVTGAQLPAAPWPPQDVITPQYVENNLTSEEKAHGWKLLFDGKTLQGWRGFREKTLPAGWQVVGGAITRVGDGADLITAEQYDSFDLQLEWKIVAGGNSGIMFRVSESEEASYHTGPEMQIVDNGRHADGKNPFTSAGSCHSVYAPSKDVTRPPGSWNAVRLTVNGNRVEHWLNGEPIVRYVLLSQDWEKRVQASKFKQWPKYGREPRGHIALQNHGDRVAFRNIRIRPLKPNRP
jgi:hypothetical protein